MDRMEDRSFRLGLLLAGGSARIRRLVGETGDGENLRATLAGSAGTRSAADTAAQLATSEVPEVLRRVEAAGWRWMVPGESGYPVLLQAVADPPLGLFVRGELDDAPTVTVVGSRKATPYGRQVARLLGEELGRAGVVVVSGMARGIDEAAHRGALAAGGTSWAVWGTGPDRLYPPEHGDLAEALAESGALLTEYPPGTPPRRYHFPERNRILAGVARAVVVVEAGVRSGALVTARLGLEEGREVLAVPGNIFSEASIGPNALLRLGARPMLTPRDVFDAIDVVPPPSSQMVEEAELMRHLEAGEALTVDEIAARAGKMVGDIHGDLLELELSGDLHRGVDGRYARTRSEPAGQ